MPIQWTLKLAEPVNLEKSTWPDILHAIGCQFFEQPSTNHTVNHKPFTTRHAGELHTLTGVVLNWLLDQPPPVADIPEELRLGTNIRIVEETNIRRTRFTDIATKDAGRRIKLAFTTPTHIRHHGTNYLLPDPYLVYTGLGRRLRSLHPDSCTDEHLRVLTHAVVIHEHDIHTETFSWHGTRSTGFLGTTTFGIPATTSTETHSLFRTLNGLATIAGVGHGTTHGLGAVRIATAE